MANTLILSASFIYLLATVIYGGYLLRFSSAMERAGRWVLGMGVLVQWAAAGIYIQSGALAFRLYDLLLVASTLIMGVALALQLKKKTPLALAFITPVNTMVIYSLHVFSYEKGAVGAAEIQYVTPIHVLASAVGFLVFAVAGGAAVMEIIKEYRLKTKRVAIHSTHNRLPSLRRLEQTSHKALVLGFPLYSIGMVLGAIWFAKGGAQVTRHFVMASVSWILYAVTLHARVVVGLRGRQAAILTLSAFVLAVFVVVLSALRAGG